MNGSEVSFTGTLGKDPELRYTTGGRPVASTSVAVSRRWQKDGKWEEATNWWNLVIWGEMAENAAASLTKGSRVMVNGRLEQRSYEKDGETKYITELVVDEIGAALRWATVQIEKTERTTGDGGYGGNSSSGAPEPVYTDEEPF